MQYGLMVETTVSGLRIGTEHSELHAPAELHLPLTGGFVDKDYLAVLWPVVTAGTDEARRVGRAIDWLDLLWRNTTSITEEMRIMTLKAGFEILFDSEDVVVLRERLSALLDEPEAPRQTRTWTSTRLRTQTSTTTASVISGSPRPGSVKRSSTRLRGRPRSPTSSSTLLSEAPGGRSGPWRADRDNSRRQEAAGARHPRRQAARGVR